MAITWIKNREVVSVTHEGLVLREGEYRDVRVMSDIWALQSYALVWNAEEGRPQEVMVSSDFDLDTSPFGQVVVDATPEVAAAYKAVLDEREAERVRDRELAAELDRKDAWNAPAFGKRMKVVRGRKVAKGTEGTVFWFRDGRVGLDLSGVRDTNGHYVNVAWVNATNLENAEPLPAKVAMAA